MSDDPNSQSIADPETIGMWAVRFRSRISHPLNSEEAKLPVVIAGKKATISCHRGSNLKESQGIIITVRGFESESDAQAFALQLRFGVLASAVARGTGADVGEDRATSGFAKFLIDEWEKQGQLFIPDVHGIYVYCRSAPEFSLIVSGNGSVSEPVEGFIDRLNTMIQTTQTPAPKILSALELVARAGMGSEPLARAVLYISAVEMLAARPWNKGQKALIKRLKDEALAAEDVSSEDALEVSKAVEGTHKFIKQGIKRFMLEDLKMTIEDWEEFSQIYDLRSRILHGEYLPRATYDELANGARKICQRIVLVAAGIN